MILMTVNELKQVLNNMAWEEQIEFEMSERDCTQFSERPAALERKVRQVARNLNSTLLDELQQDEPYVVWALRLSPHVPGDHALERARPFLQHPDGDIRYWAVRIVEHIDRTNVPPKES